MYRINRNKPQECPHPGTACVAWDSLGAPLCQPADLHSEKYAVPL